MVKICTYLSLILVTTTVLSAQSLQFSSEIEPAVFYTSETTLPFWMHANSSTLRTPQTDASLLGNFEAEYRFDSFSITGGASLMLRDGLKNNFQRRDLYLQYQNKWLNILLGSKRQTEVLDDLSSSNQNFLLSNNARPLPGLLIEANNPIKLFNWVELDWGLGHYLFNDENRYVKDTRLHYKRLGAIFTINQKHKLTARMQHFVQWGGTSPLYGALENDFNAFIEVFLGLKSSADSTAEGEQINAVGNHLASHFLEYQFFNNLGEFRVYHEHPFEDGSGARFKNFPDGIWGFYFKPINQKVFSSFLYEYIDTTTQSGTEGVAAFDNYFNNTIYRSGWTYETQIIGLPFFVVDTSIDFNNNIGVPVIVNSITAHHFGVSGAFQKFNWKLKSTYVNRLGQAFNLLPVPIKNWHNYFEVDRSFESLGSFSVLLGLDVGNTSETNFGAGITYSYTF